MRIETDRLILRDLREEDIEPLAAISADPHVMRFYPAPYSRERTASFVHHMAEKSTSGGLGVLAAELRESGRMAGYIGLSYPTFAHPISALPEIGWRLAPDLWGQGLAPEGAKACLAYGFQKMGLSEIVSYTIKANLPSQRVMEKIGMNRDPDKDFDHPNIAVDSPLRRHLVWKAVASPNL